MKENNAQILELKSELEKNNEITAIKKIKKFV